MLSPKSGDGEEGAKNGGVFHRLRVASEWLSSLLSEKSPDKLGFDCTELKTFDLAKCVRQSVQYIEALDLFLMDMKNGCIFRYNNKGGIGAVDCSRSTIACAIVQIAFSILLGNSTRIIVRDEDKPKLDLCLKNIEDEKIRMPIIVMLKGSSHIDHIVSSKIQFSTEGDIICPSICPSLSAFLEKEVCTGQVLCEKYGKDVELMDEFDLLPDCTRKVFVKERSTYLLSEVRRSSKYFSALKNNELSDAPKMSGLTLLKHVQPFGNSLLSCTSSTQTPNGHDPYAVAFATGGSTGHMKFVYRSDWEDQENARYLAKGLYANGIRKSDVVVNFLSSGFWGGMHVFNLALSYVGCSVIPIGPSFSCQDVVDFIEKLKPTAILGMPSFVITLADFVCRNGYQNCTSIRSIITGGEVLFDDMKHRIREAFQVESFLSTGYTSNETGAIGFQCKHLPNSHFHIHENMQHVKIEKDSSVCHVSGGKIISTNLNRTLLPMINYEIGDTGLIISDAPKCPCGRTLSVLQLFGRCDNRIRIGGEDIYFTDITKCLQNVKGLTQQFSLELRKSERQFDEVLLHVESIGNDSVDSNNNRIITDDVLRELGLGTQLTWEMEAAKVDDDEFLGAMKKKRKYTEGIIELPKVIIHERNGLPRNPRTGKVALLSDNR